MPNTISTACDFNHLLHPLSMPKKEGPPGLLRRITGAAILILSIPFTLGILTGLYLYWAHKKVVRINKEETQTIDQTLQKLFGQNVGKQPKNSPFVQTAQSLRKGNTEKAFEQMKDLKTSGQLTEEASQALLEAAIEQNKTELIDPILGEFTNIAFIPLHKAKTAEMVRLLNDRGASPNRAIDNEGNTPLHLAANVEVAKALVERGAKVQLNDRNYTPLHTCRDPEVARYLTSPDPDGLGIDVNDHIDQPKPPIFTVPINVKIALIRDLNADPTMTGSNGESLLHCCEDPELAQLLLDKGVDINIRDATNSTPLLTVRNPKVLQLLIEKGADVRAIDRFESTILHRTSLPESLVNLVLARAGEPSLLTLRNVHGSTPLFTNPSDEMKIRLIKKGADPKALDSNENTTLHFCQTKELAKILIDRKVDVNSTNLKGQTPLHLADNVEMATFLLDNHSDINALDVSQDNLPLFWTTDQDEIRKLLIERGADLTIKDARGRTALHHAVISGDLESVRLLIDKLDPNVLDGEGNTPLNLLLRRSMFLNENDIEIIKLLAPKTNLKAVDNQQRTALHHFLKHNPEVELIKTLFIDNGADPTVLDNAGSNLLFYTEDIDVAKLLIEKRVDPKQANHAGQTALFFAPTQEFAKYLVETCGVDITQRDVLGRTPLHTCGKYTALEWMINEGHLDPKAIDSQGQTPLHHQITWDMDIIKLLIDKGAGVNAKDNQGRTPLHFCRDKYAAKILIQKGALKDVVDSSGQVPKILEKLK